MTKPLETFNGKYPIPKMFNRKTKNYHKLNNVVHATSVAKTKYNATKLVAIMASSMVVMDSFLFVFLIVFLNVGKYT